jgi:hypothetical protein
LGGLGRLAAQAIYWGHVAGDELRGIRAQQRRPDSPDAAD